MNYSNAEFIKSYATSSQLEQCDMPEICFCGRSNVGKSSLINKVLGRKSIARVSSKPGKTITVNFYKVDNIHFVDLPGYGYAKVSFDERNRWSDLMEGYFKSSRNIKMVFQLIDMRHPATDFDLSMIDFLNQMEIPYSIILTKSDKLNKTETEKRLSLVKDELNGLKENAKIIPFSVLSGNGTEKIRKIIEDVIKTD